jgi:hypothetical protein
MTSVVGRIKEVKQPPGGHVSPKLFQVLYPGGATGPTPLDHHAETVSPGLVGTAVDYLTRLANGAEPREAFRISLLGAERLGPSEFHGADWAVENLKPGRVNVEAIRVACRLVNYDVAYRRDPRLYNPDARTSPDETTVAHISTMVERSREFFREHGPIMLDGFTFEGAYTSTVQTGDGDFLTPDTLWDFKVMVAAPKSDHTLQLLMYYIMGRRSIHAEFQAITHLGLFNPRLNTAYRLPVAAVPIATIADVERDVIGYT